MNDENARLPNYWENKLNTKENNMNMDKFLYELAEKQKDNKKKGEK